MSYWILALPREDMEHCIKVGTFGLSRKYTLGKVKKGDGVLCYVTRDNKFIAKGQATSDYYMDDKKIFKRAGSFPDRFDFKAESFGQKSEVDIKTMIDDLSFITNKYYWSVYFRNGIVQIPEKDWNLIANRLKQPVLS